MSFQSKTETANAANAGDGSTAARLKNEEAYNARVQKLYEDTTRKILTLQRTQVSSQRAAVLDMTRAFEGLLTRTTEMVGFMIGQLMMGGQVAGKSFFASFLDMLSQFTVLLGTMAIAASKMLEMLFSGNPAGLFVAGLALVLVGGVIKAFANSLRAQGAQGGSTHGATATGAASGGASGSGTSSAGYVVSEARGSSKEEAKATIIYNFQGGLYDERGLARIALGAINRHAGKSAPLLTRKALENA